MRERNIQLQSELFQSFPLCLASDQVEKQDPFDTNNAEPEEVQDEEEKGTKI
jgi:hypothetical protein